MLVGRRTERVHDATHFSIQYGGLSMAATPLELPLADRLLCGSAGPRCSVIVLDLATWVAFAAVHNGYIVAAN